ncbi:MAG: phosphatidylserine decarboxylase [Myxococcales bacterium]|nr:phosphatidylserine decarboxylase [Myxococcales bacterium]
MKDALIVSALSLLPRNTLAKGMGSMARASASRVLTRAFVRAYGVDLSEATGSLDDYPTLEALFTRELVPGARPVCGDPDALVSPVDGRVAAIGRTDGGGIEVAPGRTLELASLLDREQDGEWEVAVLYLSPKDYHRVHVPREGTVVDWDYVPGTLWPVFPAAVRRVDGLFAKNERFRVGLATDLGTRLEVVLVGAFGVGRIEVCATDVLSNAGAGPAAGTPTPPLPVARGGWLGTFHLGSTVVLAGPPGSIDWEVGVGEHVRMGERIASVAPSP